MLVLFFAYKLFLFTTFEPVVARFYGVPTGWVDAMFALLLAATVVVSMQVLGVMLIAAATVIPHSRRAPAHRQLPQAGAHLPPPLGRLRSRGHLHKLVLGRLLRSVRGAAFGRHLRPGPSMEQSERARAHLDAPSLPASGHLSVGRRHCHRGLTLFCRRMPVFTG